MCNANAVKSILAYIVFALYFFLRGIGGGFGHPHGYAPEVIKVAVM